jgi:hypothetical protein
MTLAVLARLKDSHFEDRGGVHGADEGRRKHSVNRIEDETLCDIRSHLVRRVEARDFDWLRARLDLGHDLPTPLVVSLRTNAEDGRRLFAVGECNEKLDGWFSRPSAGANLECAARRSQAAADLLHRRSKYAVTHPLER